LFSCCTIHVFIKFRYLYKDLIQVRNPNGALEAGTPALRTADALVTLIDFFAELVLLYRLWVIWERNYYIIIFPAIVSLAFVSCAMATIGILVSTPEAAIVPPSLVPLGTAAFAIPLCFNFMVTFLIVGRIWYMARKTQFALRNSKVPAPSNELLQKAMIVCIESGVLYVLVQFVLTVLFAINHPAQILLADISTQIYGIAPTLIFVRVGQGDSADSNVFARLSSTQHGSLPRNRSDQAIGRYRSPSTGMPSSPRSAIDRVDLAVSIESQTHVKDEGYELKSWPTPSDRTTF